MKKEYSYGAVVYQIKDGIPLYLIEHMHLGHTSLPKGHIEEGETPLQCTLREIKEETSLDADVGDFCEAVQNDYMHKRTVQVIMYLENIKGEVKISEEHTDWMWANLEKIKSLEISTSLKKILEKRNWEI
jgi:8-oxo-dGTP diphosphatase